MEKIILEYISKYVSLSEEESKAILEFVPYKTFTRGTHILRQGQISNECYFNIKGLVRQYELVDGEEKTTFFYTEGDALVAFDSAAKRIPSTFNWVCDEDTTLVIGRLDKIEEAYAKNPKLEKMSALFINQEFGKYQNLSSSLNHAKCRAAISEPDGRKTGFAGSRTPVSPRQLPWRETGDAQQNQKKNFFQS